MNAPNLDEPGPDDISEPEQTPPTTREPSEPTPISIEEPRTVDASSAASDPMSDEQIIETIHSCYLSQPNLREAWNLEEFHIRAIIPAIRSATQGHYRIGEALGVGGAGVVLAAQDEDLGTARALKFSRPSPGKQALLSTLLASESERMIQLSHPYIMRVHSRGSITAAEETTVSFYVMDRFATGTPDAANYVLLDDVDEEDVLRTLERIFEAVVYIHRHRSLHLDIKPENILVRDSGEPVLIDFGFAKELRSSEGMTLIGGTAGYIHPDAFAYVEEAESDQNRLRGEVLRRAVKVAWDLHPLGRTVLRLLEVMETQGTPKLSLYSHRYLKLLAFRLLDGKNRMQETLLGLTGGAFEELRYITAEEALTDIRKLTGSYSVESRVLELSQYPAETVQASTFSTTPFTPRVKDVFAQPEFARLGSFTQLSLLNLVFPTATHTRLEHSIGAFSAMCRYVVALLRDPINPLFRQIMREEDIRAALVTALVHDVGHYGLAHDLEDVDPLFSHERRGLEILADRECKLAAAIARDRLPDGAPGWSVPPERVIGILRADVQRMEGTIRDRIIHAMIDGPIDADKIDYIVRDSGNLGVPYGAVIDIERLLRVLTVISRQSGNRTYVSIGIHEKGRVTAEAVAFARYALYGSVYWHHAYRAVKVMLHRTALEYLAMVGERDKTRHAGVPKSVADDLRTWLDGGTRGHGSGTLFSSSHAASATGGQIHPGDNAMLEWLGERSGPVGKSLVDCMRERLLYKRVLVVSRWGNAQLWKSVTEIVTSDDRQRRLDFQRNFQIALIEAVRDIDSKMVHTSIVVADERSAFIGAADRGHAVVLVDATSPKPGSTLGLEIVPEEDRRRARVDEFPSGRQERSDLWTAIQTSLHESLGKVRVFCHPKHSRFISALDRSIVEGALERAVDAT